MVNTYQISWSDNRACQITVLKFPVIKTQALSYHTLNLTDKLNRIIMTGMVVCFVLFFTISNRVGTTLPPSSAQCSTKPTSSPSFQDSESHGRESISHNTAMGRRIM